MPLKSAQFTLKRESLPVQSRDLGVRFVLRTVKPPKASQAPVERVLMVPDTKAFRDGESVGPEPLYRHILCGAGLQTGNGTVVAGSGQMVITPQRLLFMVDDGDVNSKLKLDINSNGEVYCFYVLRDDVYEPEVKKKRLKPSEFFFRSKEEAPVSFRIAAYAAWAYVAGDHLGYWYDKNMLSALSDEGRQSLLNG